MCVCCQELVYQPVTTECLHNVCKVSTHEPSFSEGIGELGSLIVDSYCLFPWKHPDQSFQLKAKKKNPPMLFIMILH